MPAVPAAGVPPSVAVPFPLSTNVTPLGSAPVFVSDGVGDPVAVTVKFPATPTVNMALLALVIAGAGTETVKVSVAVPVPPPLLALKVTVEVPAAVGVPEITPVAVFTVNPAGNPVAPKPMGELVAAI